MPSRVLLLSLVVLSLKALTVGQPTRTQQIEQIRKEFSFIRSKDNTLITYECEGKGPTLLVVHGGTGDHTRWTPLFPLFRARFTVCAMDRRGHGTHSAASAEP